MSPTPPKMGLSGARPSKCADEAKRREQEAVERLDGRARILLALSLGRMYSSLRARAPS